MTLTVFDVLDAAIIAAAFVCLATTGRWHLGWSVGALMMYHIIGRKLLTTDDPALNLSVMQTIVAVGYLLSPVLSNYGRIIGTLFLAMSLSGIVAVLTGTVPPLGQGLHFNLWNIQSALLHLAAIVNIVGILRHGHLRRAVARGR